MKVYLGIDEHNGSCLIISEDHSESHARIWKDLSGTISPVKGATIQTTELTRDQVVRLIDFAKSMAENNKIEKEIKELEAKIKELRSKLK